MRKVKIYLALSGILFVIFCAFTVILKTVDVGAVGPLGSEVGLSGINSFVFEKLGQNDTWYKISELLGFFALGVAGIICLALLRFVKLRALRNTDLRFWFTGFFYALVLAVYVAFEFIVINSRPILVDGELEASYPSSHTILTLCIMSSAVILFGFVFTKKKWVLIAADSVFVAVAVFTVLGRLLSGVHWLSDIVGGVLISAALVSLFYAAVKYAEEKQKGKAEN